MITTFIKDPNAILDYAVDWTAYLAGEDTILTSVWITPSGITQQSASNTLTRATVWLVGGASGTSYAVTNRITTAGGRTDDRTMIIQVETK